MHEKAIILLVLANACVLCLENGTLSEEQLRKGPENAEITHETQEDEIVSPKSTFLRGLSFPITKALPSAWPPSSFFCF